ncbi:MAG: hypothetical protein ACLSE6_07410 [Alphaproteobacteria bacterium]
MTFPLCRIAENPGITKFSTRRQTSKFLHADRLYTRTAFDTQIAAMVCGYGDPTVMKRWSKICDVELDKSSCLSNWSSDAR